MPRRSDGDAATISHIDDENSASSVDVAARDGSILAKLRWGAGFTLGIYWAALFVLMHTPVRAKVHVSHADKVAHFVLYGMLGLLISIWLATSGRLTWKRLLRWMVFLGAYTIVDEILQIPVGRTCEAGDWLADILGIGTAFAAAMTFQGYVLGGMRTGETGTALD